MICKFKFYGSSNDSAKLRKYFDTELKYYYELDLRRHLN
jgi:hypothetical protein